MTNKELKCFMRKNKVFQYEVAERMELSESRLSVLFRKPLDAEMQSAVIGAVEAIVKERGDAAKPSGTQALQTAAVKPVTGSIQPLYDALPFSRDKPEQAF